MKPPDPLPLLGDAGAAGSSPAPDHRPSPNLSQPSPNPSPPHPDLSIRGRVEKDSSLPGEIEKGLCATGNCSGVLCCDGRPGTTPASAVEATLSTTPASPSATSSSLLKAASAPSASASPTAATPSDEDEVELVDWEDEDEDEDQGGDDDAEEGEVLPADYAPPSEAQTLAGLEAEHAVPSALSPGVAAPSAEPPALVRASPGRGERLKSILVRPAAQPATQDENLCAHEQSPGWQAAKTRQRERNVAIPLRAAMAKQEKARNAARKAFEKRLVGRCYRCLAPGHLLAQCREPVRCWKCKGMGHFARHCSARQKPISANLRSRLSFPPDNIHSRISFPPLNHSLPPPQQPSTLNSSQPTPNHHTPHPPLIHSSSQPTTKHHEQLLTRGHTNIVSTEGILQEANRLRTHAVVISAPQEGCHATALEVACALSGQLRVPRHDIKVTCYGLGLFLAEFGSPSERDSAMMKEFVEIGGAAYPFTPWVGQAMVLNDLAAPTQDRAILIHLLGYEDCSSNQGSSEPRFVPFSWARGALDGCCISEHHHHDSRGPRPREEPRRQAVSACTRSLPTYRQALLGKAWDGNLERGRTMSRSPPRSGRERDTLAHTSDEWERRRSRSPLRYSGHSSVALQEQVYHDPMIQESQELRPSDCQLPVICYSPEGVALGQAEDESGPTVQQPVDTQVDIPNRVDTSTRSGGKVDGAAGSEDTREQTKALGAVDDVEIVDDRSSDSATFCRGIFKEAATPLLPRPQTLPRQGGRGRKRPMVATRVATRSSLRQAAHPSSVPVAQRAQQKLTRELQFMEEPARPSDVAATEYLDLYGQNLSDEAVDKIRKAARMGNKKLAKALAAVAAGMGDLEMEVP